jgi:radical SAM protein with 4Fe4S-binding SPASM domain
MPFLTLSRLRNALLALLEMTFARTKCRSRPFVYRIDPCTACNIRCPGCEAHTQKTTEKRLLSLPDFQTIVDKVKGYCIRASLYDTGEPLMNKSIYKMISYASANKISTSISTNLTLFKKEKHLHDLFCSGLTVLQPDVDGVSQATYSTYRVNGEVSVVKEAIEAIVQHKQQIGAKYPLVEPQVIMFKHLMPEKKAIENYLHGVGVDRISWKLDTWGFNPVQITNTRQRKSKRCFWLYLGMMIRPDGNVYPCTGRGFDRLPYGNILEQSLNDIWNNKYYQFSRQLFRKGPPLKYNPDMERLPCHTCTVFQKQRAMLPNPDTQRPGQTWSQDK